MKAILLVDHGSVYQEANDMLESVADLVRAEVPGVHVDIAHMELAEPREKIRFSWLAVHRRED